MKNDPVEYPNYYGILPAHVRYSSVNPIARLLYCELTALSSKDGYCSASNSYFAKLYDKNNEQISKYFKELKDAGFIAITIDKAAGNKRKIWLSEAYRNAPPIVTGDNTPIVSPDNTPIVSPDNTPIVTGDNTPIVSSDKHNNTSSFNTTSKKSGTARQTRGNLKNQDLPVETQEQNAPQVPTPPPAETKVSLFFGIAQDELHKYRDAYRIAVTVHNCQLAVVEEQFEPFCRFYCEQFYMSWLKHFRFAKYVGEFFARRHLEAFTSIDHLDKAIKRFVEIQEDKATRNASRQANQNASRPLEKHGEVSPEQSARAASRFAKKTNETEQ